jgi:hypothetical protein
MKPKIALGVAAISLALVPGFLLAGSQPANPPSVPAVITPPPPPPPPPGVGPGAGPVTAGPGFTGAPGALFAARIGTIAASLSGALGGANVDQNDVALASGGDTAAAARVVNSVSNSVISGAVQLPPTLTAQGKAVIMSRIDSLRQAAAAGELAGIDLQALEEMLAMIEAIPTVG